jgi:hypothetical protein
MTENFSDNGHDGSSSREIVLDFMFYVCSYKEAGFIRPKPSEKRGAESQKNGFRVKTVKTQVGKQAAECV